MARFFKILSMQNLWYGLYTHRIYAFFLLFLAGVSVYVSFLAWGEHSLEVLLKNREQKHILQKEVDTLQAQNAQLQKVLFELKGLEP
ncbi:hypothetical protein [Helicobacter sp. T3_23-1059]